MAKELGFFQKIPDRPNSLGSFDREVFSKDVGSWLYKDLTEGDFQSKYRRAYQFFRAIDGKPAEINPKPTPPEEIQGEITDKHLITLEGDIAALMTVTVSFLNNMDYEFFENAMLGIPPRE